MHVGKTMLDTVCQYVLQWVESNLDTGKKVKDLISSVGYSRKTVEAWFLSKYDITIGNYLFRRRMSRASILLRLTSIPITEVALLLHYYSNQNFSRAFRKFTGKTPSEYRNSERWDVSNIQLSLLYEFKPESIYKCIIPDRYISGGQYNINEPFFYSGDTQNATGIQKLMIDLMTPEQCNLIVCVDKVNKASLQKSRQGFIDTEVKAGILSVGGKADIEVVPGGTFCCADFSGSWQEYYFFRFAFFIHVLSEKKYVYTGNGYHILFYRIKSECHKFIKCTMYIPVIF